MVAQKYMNYRVLKESAKKANVKVSDLLALSPGNDPFYCGTPADIARGKWFQKQWFGLNFQTGVHLRRVHYALQASGDVVLPSPVGWTDPGYGKQTTEVYINNEACWNFLTVASKAARYLGYVDASDFVDRRNPDAVIFDAIPDPSDEDFSDPNPRIALTGGWDAVTDYYNDNDRYTVPELPSLSSIPHKLPNAPYLSARGFTGTPQKYHLTIFAEKSTMDDILLPLCEHYRINYVCGLGEMSITSVIEYLQQIAAHNRVSHRAGRILYISDYDPAGIGMPISVARKIEYYLSLLEDEDYDIALKPIILTPDQIDQYDLPTAPVKPSDKRKANFESRHGLAVELDALEALHPGVLHDIVEDEILRYYDPQYEYTLDAAKRAFQRDLDALTKQVYADFDRTATDTTTQIAQDYQALHDRWQGLQDKFAQLVDAFLPEIETFSEDFQEVLERAKLVHEDLRTQLRRVNGVISIPDVPDVDVPEEDEFTLLFNSSRGYLEQLQYYKQYRLGDDFDETYEA